LLFVALCIALPFALLQWAILVRAGLSPFQYGQLIAFTKILLIAWIPMVLIAAITSTLASSIFTLLSVAITWLVFMASTMARNARLTNTPSTHLVVGVLFALIFACILPLLYMKRAVKLSRILLAASIVLFLLMLEVVLRPVPNMPGATLLRAQYPADAAPELHLVYNVASPHTARRDANTDPDLREVTLPIKLEGLPTGARLQEPTAQFQVERGGYQYTSPWRPVQLGPDGMQLFIPSPTLEHAGHIASHLTIQLAAEEIQPDESQTSPIQDHFSIPGGGACAAINPPYEGRSPNTGVVCHFAFSNPHRIEIQRNFVSGCTRPENFPQVFFPYEAGTSLDPATHLQLNLVWERVNIPPAQRCTMQSLTTTVYRTVKRFRTSVEIPAIRLADDIDN
jgi:hypothetical protein